MKRPGNVITATLTTFTLLLCLSSVRGKSFLKKQKKTSTRISSPVCLFVSHRFLLTAPNFIHFFHKMHKETLALNCAT